MNTPFPITEYDCVVYTSSMATDRKSERRFVVTIDGSLTIEELENVLVWAKKEIKNDTN